MEQIDIRQLWHMVRRHWIILLALPVLPVLLVGIKNYVTITPYYQTSATLIVESKGAQPDKAQDQMIANSVLQQHLQNYGHLARSRTIAKSVIKELNLPLTEEKLIGLITVSQVNSTDLFTIQANNVNAALAASIANSTAQAISKQVLEDNVRIVDPAEIPAFPVVESKRKNMLAAFLVGILAALSFIFLRVYLDNTVKTPSDVKAYLGIPLLGMIAKDPRGKQGKKGKNEDLPALITLEKTTSPISESYRSLRTNVEFASLNLVTQSLLITSSGRHEGTSTTVANLAVSMAQTGKSVLVLDADLRQPSQHTLFGLEKGQGLANALVRNQDYQQYIQKTAVPGVSVLTAGPSPANPAELVGSERMKQLIQEVSGQFDHVLIDTPPIGTVTDAAILAQEVEGVLLVLASGEVNKESAQRALELLDNVGAKMLGSVLNKVIG